MLDKENGNTYWQDVIELELLQLKDYKNFHSIGKNVSVPIRYQQIPVWFVFDVKQSLKRKARLVVRGDLTKVPLDMVLSGVAILTNY